MSNERERALEAARRIVAQPAVREEIPLMMFFDDAQTVARALLSSPWQPIETAPKDATEIVARVQLRNTMLPQTLVIHWADGGGDDQPRFGPGWFYWCGSGYCEVNGKVLGWHLPPRQQETPDRVGRGRGAFWSPTTI